VYVDINTKQQLMEIDVLYKATVAKLDLQGIEALKAILCPKTEEAGPCYTLSYQT
jgi:hypothetical protein